MMVFEGNIGTETDSLSPMFMLLVLEDIGAPGCEFRAPILRRVAYHKLLIGAPGIKCGTPMFFFFFSSFFPMQFVEIPLSPK